jgi:hypothetical protein
MKQLTTQEMESVQGGFLFLNALEGVLTAGKGNPGYNAGRAAGQTVTDLIQRAQETSFAVAQTATSMMKGFFSGLFGR